MEYKSSQSLDDWAKMLDAIYSSSQNYAKTPYEIHAHLTEVCGIFAKHFFKKKSLVDAKAFLPKIFAWSIALFKKVQPNRTDLEEIILRKFPNCCPYCFQKACTCWKGQKPTPDENKLRAVYFQNAKSVSRSLNDFQLMFREIYEDSWKAGDLDEYFIVQRVFVRLVEEVAEIGESIRFHHLYPENFENELADIFAWWFALVSLFPTDGGGEVMLAEDLLWTAYPGNCPDCFTLPCLCRPGPVRQLMSKPTPGHSDRFDALTSIFNQSAYIQDTNRMTKGEFMAPAPISCARIDVDDFKKVNDSLGHGAGDEALRHIASVISKAVRESDRVYRAGGDEFAVIFINYTREEAFGAMRRVCGSLMGTPVRWISPEGNVNEFPISVSIGVAEVASIAEVEKALKLADEGAYESKQKGKAQVTMI